MDNNQCRFLLQSLNLFCIYFSNNSYFLIVIVDAIGFCTCCWYKSNNKGIMCNKLIKILETLYTYRVFWVKWYMKKWLVLSWLLTASTPRTLPCKFPYRKSRSPPALVDTLPPT